MKKLESQKITQAKFAETLGVDKKLIAYHVRKGGAPMLGDVAAWTEHLALAGRDGSMPADQRRLMAAQRLRIATATAEKLEAENKVRLGELLDLASVQAEVLEAERFYFEELDRLQREGPVKLSGLQPAEVRDALKKLLGDLRERSRQKFAAVGNS